jgi:predicted nucleic-acid-binding Zn-ribbon protein
VARLFAHDARLINFLVTVLSRARCTLGAETLARSKGRSAAVQKSIERHQDAFEILEDKMRNGHCPKCNSTEVYQRSDIPFTAGDGKLHLHVSGNDVYLDAFICVNCGCVEMQVNNASQAKLAMIKNDKEWRRVSS